ncbi:MAG: tRNA dihydrouridine(20/20a) synthase DusA, partial [Betaproteobacteria bacterium]|nr:tRNA dihydrouridine(20/20a) synthase DusA [Betaproteobacteria bacterium]
CPSERVQRGAFGACLMREPDLVADCIKAMQDAVSIPVTVKHRIGVDDQEDYGFVRDFVGKLFQVGCRVFFVHARSAILKGLSPKENREIPPLRMSVVRQLKQDFQDAVIVANGGIQTLEQAQALMAPSVAGPAVDGVMIGRAAYHDPWLLHGLQSALCAPGSTMSFERQTILGPLQSYFEAQRANGISARFMTRHWHGLFHGQPGARRWRREICEGTLGPKALFDQLSAEFPG